MNGKERNDRIKKIKRESIIDAAEQLFSNQGYDATNMDQISGLAEFSKRTVYAYFSSKEQLLSAVTTRAFRKLNAYFEQELEVRKNRPVIDRIMGLSEAYIRFADEYPAYFNMIVDYQIAETVVDSEDPFMAECYREGEKTFDFLRELIIEGRQAGEMTDEMEVTDLVLFLWQNIIGMITLISKKKSYLDKYLKKTPRNIIDVTNHYLKKVIQIS